jgi:hypothetical protein
MTKKTSKVTAVYPIMDQNNQPKIWNGQHGVLFIMGVTFENGDAGEFMCKDSQKPSFSIGESTEYELNTTQYGNRIKKINPEFQKGGGGRKGPEERRSIERQTALNRAVDIHIAMLNNGTQSSINDLKTNAIVFYDWISKTAEEMQNLTVPTTNQSEDDLPY